MEHAENEHVDHAKTFTVLVVATSKKEVATHASDLVGELKRAALKAFAIPSERAPEYRLALRPGDPASELDENKTVHDYHLHKGSTVYLVKPHNDA